MADGKRAETSVVMGTCSRDWSVGSRVGEGGVGSGMWKRRVSSHTERGGEEEPRFLAELGDRDSVY